MKNKISSTRKHLNKFYSHHRGRINRTAGRVANTIKAGMVSLGLFGFVDLGDCLFAHLVQEKRMVGSQYAHPWNGNGVDGIQLFCDHHDSVFCQSADGRE